MDIARGCVRDINKEQTYSNLENVLFMGIMIYNDVISQLQLQNTYTALPCPITQLHVVPPCLTSISSQNRGFCCAVMKNTWIERGETEQIFTPHSSSMQV
jgi:hypothetical protein